MTWFMTLFLPTHNSLSSPCFSIQLFFFFSFFYFFHEVHQLFMEILFFCAFASYPISCFRFSILWFNSYQFWLSWTEKNVSKILRTVATGNDSGRIAVSVVITHLKYIWTTVRRKGANCKTVSKNINQAAKFHLVSIIITPFIDKSI